MITNRFFSKLDFALKKRRKWFFVPILFLLLYGLRLVVLPFNELWENNFAVVASAATLIAAVILAIGELNSDWEAQLPKRLTVIFTFDALIVMRCEEAYLAGESDIRQWSQQLGKQMSDGEYLEFEPYVEQSDKIEERGEDILKIYTTSFRLTKVPKKHEPKYKEGFLNWRWVKTDNRKEETFIKHNQA